MLGRRWDAIPDRIRLLVAGEVAVLGYGAGVHVVQLFAADFAPYPEVPGWLAAYFVSLTLADPLAAALLWLRRRAGLYLAVAVLVTDAAANAYAIYGFGVGGRLAPVGQAVVTVIALVVVGTAPLVLPWLRKLRPRAPDSSQ